MPDLGLLTLSIGLGLVVALLLGEVFGACAGGLIVPGYLALYLARPLDVALTLAVAGASYALVRLAASFVIVYGRRRTVLTILVAFLLGAALDAWLGGGFPLAAPRGETGAAFELSSIGFIIPGLIAVWMDREGVPETLCGLTICAVVTRLLLILVAPEAVLHHAAAQPSLRSLWTGA